MTADTGERNRWERVLLGGALAILAGILVNQVVLAKAIIPPLLVFGVLLIGALVLRRSRWRAGTIAVMVVALIILLGSVPFVLEDLSHPASAPSQFTVTAAMALGVVCSVVAAIALLRRWAEPSAYRVAGAAIVVFVVAAVGAGVLAAGGDDDTTTAGDVPVRTKNAAFDPKDIQVTSGGGVFVTNDDLIRHTFTVTDQAIDVEIPAGRSRRIAIGLPGGSYPLRCTVLGHEAMKGTLTVR